MQDVMKAKQLSIDVVEMCEEVQRKLAAIHALMREASIEDENTAAMLYSEASGLIIDAKDLCNTSLMPAVYKACEAL